MGERGLRLHPTRDARAVRQLLPSESGNREGNQEGKQEGKQEVDPVGEDTWRYDVNTVHWRDPGRPRLWPIPLHDEPQVWRKLRTECSREDGCTVRILRSHSTPGYIIFTVCGDGLARLTTWHYLPDLLMFNPVAFFLEHPKCNSIYIETIDSDRTDESSAATDVSGLETVGYNESASTTTSNNNEVRIPTGTTQEGNEGRNVAPSSSSSDDGQSIDYALVLHRRECDILALEGIQDNQRSFFTLNRLVIPPASDFLSTLHGR